MFFLTKNYGKGGKSIEVRFFAGISKSCINTDERHARGYRGALFLYVDCVSGRLCALSDRNLALYVLGRNLRLVTDIDL